MKFIVAITTTILSTFVCASSDISVYFNHLESESYTDPYRNITRPGQDLEKVIIDTILEADTSIDVAVQELRLPNIAKALAVKALQGVKVRVVLENNYNNTLLTMGDENEDETNQHEASRFVDLFAFIDMDNDNRIEPNEMAQRDAIHILHLNNIPIKDDTHDGSMGSGLMHHKFLVIDGETLLVSTANFTLSGIHGDFTNPLSRGNANSLVKIKSKSLVKSYKEEFELMWGSVKGSRIPMFGNGKPYRAPRTAKVSSSSVTTQFSPTSRTLSWKRSVNGLIGKTLKKAKKEVLMGLFVFSEQRLADILQDKHEENHYFRLGVLVEPKFAYRYYSELLDMWGIGMLDNNCQYEAYNNPWALPHFDVGAPIMASGDFLHHKFAVIDRETVIVGSQNWSDSANHQNDENLLVIKNKKIAQAYAQEFERMERRSRKGPPKSLLRRVEKMEESCLNYL
ncbi:MAG: competence protein ComE [Halobacteriovoraceae bacterium]|nr:competence protein ComE [Halobacteriovoraceae bacterium]